MNHVKISKSWPPRDAPSKPGNKKFSPDHGGQVEMRDYKDQSYKTQDKKKKLGHVLQQWCCVLQQSSRIGNQRFTHCNTLPHAATLCDTLNGWSHIEDGGVAAELEAWYLKSVYTAIHCHTQPHSQTHKSRFDVCSAVRCSVLQWYLCCSALQCVTSPATHCNTLQHTATHCNTLPRAATLWQALRRDSTRLLRRVQIWRKALQCVQRCVAACCSVLHSLQHTPTCSQTLKRTRRNSMCVVQCVATHCGTRITATQRTAPHTWNHALCVSECGCVCSSGICAAMRCSVLHSLQHTGARLDVCAAHQLKNA